MNLTPINERSGGADGSMAVQMALADTMRRQPAPQQPMGQQPMAQQAVGQETMGQPTGLVAGGNPSWPTVGGVGVGAQVNQGQPSPQQPMSNQRPLNPNNPNQYADGAPVPISQSQPGGY